MKHLLFGLLSIVCFSDALADRLNAGKEKIAQQFTYCANHPSKDAGNSYLDECYDNTIKKLVSLGDSYAHAQLRGADEDTAANIQADKDFFKRQLQFCEKYFDISDQAQHRKTEFVLDCKLRTARAYAEYFFQPTEKELLAQQHNLSYKQLIRWQLGLSSK